MLRNVSAWLAHSEEFPGVLRRVAMHGCGSTQVGLVPLRQFLYVYSVCTAIFGNARGWAGK